MGTEKIDDFTYRSFLHPKDADKMKYFLDEKWKSVQSYFEQLSLSASDT